jgi:hypothetical protein
VLRIRIHIKVKSRTRIRFEVKSRELWGSQWSHGGSIGQWLQIRVTCEESYPHQSEKSDPDPNHNKSWVQIRIRILKSLIRIRITFCMSGSRIFLFKVLNFAQSFLS